MLCRRLRKCLDEDWVERGGKLGVPLTCGMVADPADGPRESLQGAAFGGAYHLLGTRREHKRGSKPRRDRRLARERSAPGRCSRSRAREVTGLRYLRPRSDLFGQAEVREVAVLVVSLVRDEDVPRLHVAVDESMGMGCVKGAGSLRDEA